MSRGMGTLATLAVSTLTFKVCRLCNAKSNEESPLRDAHPSDCWGGLVPWLHYRKVVVAGRELKEASGKVCSLCEKVFLISPMRLTHGSIAGYISWRNSGDSINRHAAFMRGHKSFVNNVNRGTGRVHSRHTISEFANFLFFSLSL